MTSLRTLELFPVILLRPRERRGIGLLRMSKLAGVIVFLAVAIAAPAQTLTTIASFDKTNGDQPLYVSLVQGFDGNLYGTTSAGGASTFYGTVFKITPAGTLTTLHSFNGSDGSYPYAGLMLSPSGAMFGTTKKGGDNGYGTVFKITSGGTFTTVYSFCAQTKCADGSGPYAGLVRGTDGNFYGTTESGGANGLGTVFKITPTGTLTTLHSFAGSDGSNPYAGLVQATNGAFYGTTFGGGANSQGTVFKITPGGTLTTLHSFNGTDGSSPYGGLVQSTFGNLFGTTSSGGVYDAGSIFKITPAGTLTTLYSFCANTNCADGTYPTAGLIQATDGNFYGTTQDGGAGTFGTIFKITAAGKFTTLQSFTGDGAYPYGGLFQSSSGTFYGTTYGGGSSLDGAVFSLTDSLGPFVETLPSSGKVGVKVTLLGNNLAGTTTVTFNGTVAVFKVVSSTEITTTVPTGATTGIVEVTTPHGIVKSNVAFRVP